MKPNIKKSHRLKDIVMDDVAYRHLLTSSLDVAKAASWEQVGVAVYKLSEILANLIWASNAEKPNKQFVAVQGFIINAIEVTIQRDGYGKRCFNIRFITNHRFYANHQPAAYYTYDIMFIHTDSSQLWMTQK